MINRYYICEKCDYHLVVQQSLHDEKRLKKCPKCKKHTLYQDLSGQHTFIYGEPTTVEHQADRNTSRAGKYELEHKRGEPKPKKKGPWYNPENKDLNKELAPIIGDKKKMRKYVKDGEI